MIYQSTRVEGTLSKHHRILHRSKKRNKNMRLTTLEKSLVLLWQLAFPSHGIRPIATGRGGMAGQHPTVQGQRSSLAPSSVAPPVSRRE